jgi:hypothetical protein
MVHVYNIPASGVNAMYNNGDSFAVIAPGRFETTDEKLADFLSTYPGVAHIEDREEILVRPNFGQHGHAEDQVTVLSGGISGGGAMNARQKAQQSGDVSK